MNYTPGPNEESSLGIDWKVVVILGYIFSFVGLIFFLLEKKSKFIRFHCAQATVLFIALVVLGFVNIIPIIGQLVWGLGWLLVYVFAIIALINAAKGQWYRIPLVADFADKLSGSANAQ